ncbi:MULTISPECIES: hypothetical protein [Mesorhizobium]|uniref:Uncharacterized protein n=1 Tax=Mesorhizobium shonense TaxID=1209948 RepID=A0ABV2HQH2_9HYPH|nr:MULTISPECIES: hypothetical protein [unclassified Mesorhizobium]AZO28954.1 hypothetical protein EJ071_17260 [Mesorhizobium sp. M1B.F.Ca.ET.045.04.1.1]RWB21342.1 MAG: hypothetical protein EOQ40_11135 [Mesorhizobium sp.]RWE01892.1 MAG: hypothetical protein EOS40_09945 [Mesorhizobium sp.]TIS50895.1 MAG: hypothetical protein E5W96_04260 [Mesorhizobium sp.]TIU01390.1 MAG: hypothetical protein E5W55_00505 [Mesorhizobium sp.]
MSDDYHRPTYTSTDAHGAFNATQVRLYGVPGLPKPEHKNDFGGINTIVKENQYAITFSKLAEGDLDYTDELLQSIRLMFDKQEDKKPDSSYVFVKSVLENYMLLISAIDIQPETKKDTKKFSSGIIFGYAYEGHTYDLPKPKIMLIPAPPLEIPSDDSGYDLKKDYYRVWIVDKLDQCVEFEMNQGFIEQLVLEANLPGKRSPTMYAARQALGHRSGRLTE